MEMIDDSMLREMKQSKEKEENDVVAVHRDRMAVRNVQC